MGLTDEAIIAKLAYNYTIKVPIGTVVVTLRLKNVVNHDI